MVWIKQRVAEVGQGPSGTPIATPWVHPTVSWSQPIQGNLGPIRPDLVMPPVRTMLGPGPEVSRPVIDATARQRSQELVLAQRDYATSLRRASDVTNQQAARYVDLKTIQRPPTDLLGLGPGRFAEKTSEAAGRRVLPSSGQTYPMPVSSARQLLDHPSPRQSKVDRLLSDDQFRGMPPDVAERFQSTARRVFESLPGLSKYVGAIGTETFPEIPDVWGAGRVPGSSGNGRARRPVFDRDGNVIEGGRIGVNPAISEAEIARAVRSGAKAGAPDVSRVAAHELGHQIDYVGQNAYIQKLFPGSRLGSGNYQAGYEQYVDELRGIITKGQPGMSVQDILRRDISGYAADMFDKKPGEAMAEATALMYTGKVNPTAQRIYDWTVRQSGLGPTSDAFGTIGDQGEANLPVLARQQQLLDRQIAYETAAVRGPSSGQIPLPTQSVAGGAGGIPPSPPRIGSGFGDEDDDEVRRLKAQLAAALRRRIQALNAETEASKQIAATTSSLRERGPLRNIDRLRVLENAYDEWSAGNNVSYQALVSSVIPRGSERAGYILSNDPFGRKGFDQALIRDIIAQRRALSAGPVAGLGRLALPAPTAQEELNRRRYRQAAQEIIPPGSMRPRFLAGPNAYGGVGDPFNFGSLNLGVGSGVADPEIIAANQARRSPFQRFSTLDEAQEARRAGDDQAYRGLVASVVPKGAERARFMLSNDPFGYGGFEQELLRDIGAQRRALSAGPVAGLGRLALPVAPEPIELGGEAWRARNRTEFKEWVDATSRDAESPTRTRGRHQASPEEIEYAEGQVAGARLRAGASRHIEGDPELRDDLASSQATLHTNRFDQKQRRNEAIDDQGRADTLPKSERKRLGSMLPEEEIADFEQRATKFSKAVGRITDQDLKTPEGQGVLQALGEHGQRLRAEMEGVIAPEGDGVLAESLYRSRKLVDSGISDVDFASERGETRAAAEAREAAEARRVTQAEAAAARKRFLNESPAGQMQNLKGYLGTLREEMGSLRVNPDITAAKQKFAELSVLLSALEEKAAGIEVDPEDGRAVENYAKLRSGIQQQRANLESIGSQLGQRETFAKYEQDMAAWRQARAGRSAGRKLTDWFTMRSTDEPVMPEGYAPTGGGRGGGGGFDGGGPGGLGGADGPNDRRGFSRFLYNARHRGGALGFFETGALSTLRYGLPSMAMYGAMSGISNATREAEEFRFTMEKVRAQLADTFGSGSDQIFEHFKNNILDLSKETGVQADVLASLGMQFQGAFGSETIGGLSGQALVESQLQAAAKLSQVTKIPAAELTDGLTAASFGFNRTNEDISNVALRLESLSGVTAKETIGFIGDIAPVATEAGFSLEELASMAAIAQQKSGRSGAALAESFGRIIPAISNSKDKLLELADADKALQAPEFLKALSGGDIKTTLLFLVKNFQNLTKSSQDLVVTALGGRREAQALLAAVGDQGQLDKYISGVAIREVKNCFALVSIRFNQIFHQSNRFLGGVDSSTPHSCARDVYY